MQKKGGQITSLEKQMSYPGYWFFISSHPVDK